MALADPELFNDYWVYMRDMIHPPWGSSLLNPSQYQIHNAYQMRAALQLQGYDEYAIAGIIGNAQVESGITTGAIQKPSVLPNGGESMADVPNSYMLQYYNPPSSGAGYGLGLLQWDRLSALYLTNDLLGWTNANGYDWYDGAGQMARLDFEFNNDSIYHFWRQNYQMTWAEFKDFHNSRPTWGADDAADVWASNWELSSLSPEGRQARKDNALYWFDWFAAHPTEPGGLKVWLLYKYAKERRGYNVRKRIFV